MFQKFSALEYGNGYKLSSQQVPSQYVVRLEFKNKANNLTKLGQYWDDTVEIHCTAHTAAQLDNDLYSLDMNLTDRKVVWAFKLNGKGTKKRCSYVNSQFLLNKRQNCQDSPRSKKNSSIMRTLEYNAQPKNFFDFSCIMRALSTREYGTYTTKLEKICIEGK